jgi:hypothetical protein|tara:strand:+ start:2333 stop:2902 length:570 start_codon:yes stop_codon:yes gene_type:complete
MALIGSGGVILITTAVAWYWWAFVNAAAYNTILAVWVMVSAIVAGFGYYAIRAGITITVRVHAPSPEQFGSGAMGARYNRRDRLSRWWNKTGPYWYNIGGGKEIWLYTPISDPGEIIKADWAEFSPVDFGRGPGQSSKAFYKRVTPTEIQQWNRDHARRPGTSEVVKWGVVLAMFGGFMFAGYIINPPA